jgi:hypothetical protein
MDFIAQYNDLRKKFPFPATVGTGNTNCDYSDNVFKSSNCFYVFESFDTHDSYYCEDHGGSANTEFDCRFGINGNRNCECIDYADSSDCYFSQSFARCYNLWYCYYCVDSHDCFGCSNLHNKSYCIFNVQHTKEEYESKLPELKKMSMKEVLAKRLELIKQFPQLHSEHLSNENSEYCDYSYYVKNCYYCFDCANDQDCGYLTASYECKDSWDCDYIVRGEQVVESSHSGDSYNCYKISDCDRCYDSYYLEDCTDCHDCIGCVKLSHRRYCILNIQYTKGEYEKKLFMLKNDLRLSFSSSV